jgi:hypothetical protein
LMNPTGTRTRSSRRPLIENPLPSEAPPIHQQLASSLANHDYDSSGRATATAMLRGSSSPSPSPEDATPNLSVPLPKSKELPVLPRSRSSQGLSTFYHSTNASAPVTLATIALPNQQQKRPLSLSGFPEPPSRVYSNGSSRIGEQALDSSINVKPLASSSTTSLPAVVAETPVRVNSRLWRIRNARGLPNLDTIPPSGPPPTCPLPATPSPRKRHFRPLPKASFSRQDRSNEPPPSKSVATKVATTER